MNVVTIMLRLLLLINPFLQLLEAKGNKIMHEVYCIDDSDYYISRNAKEIDSSYSM